MNLNEYTKLAVRTESNISSVKTNRESLVSTLELLKLYGELLDSHKKFVFYGKRPKKASRLSIFFRTVLHAFKALFTRVDALSKREDIDVNPRIFHAIVGVATESAELIEILLESIKESEDFDEVHLDEEFNDINWYASLFYDETGRDRVNGLRTNIKKLQARFPENFTSEDAINRDLTKERQILEERYIDDNDSEGC